MDETFMQRALELAALAAKLGEVPVGAVIVQDDRIIAEGYNLRELQKCATAHAELLAIEQACRRLGGWRLPRCTLYVTLEPCPMCAGAIINARIDRVVYATADPKAGSTGTLTNLFDLPYNHKPLVEGGLLAKEAATLLRDFFQKLRQ